ncbi:UbiA family prenyltransferase [Reichenbachiella agarivorans]|uniref:UbiA family prenyltransferase n=1 Tax=Reichenbachiella agarivorans TaxID=2979464 RepID=A0ABY6CUI5_9BACT|nr:UbiA family prenyltransferase [Reichenbachiella agarivorans]UXP33655.1 UbiA family prenyltransferase [Reichenbachiella agarivorans]
MTKSTFLHLRFPFSFFLLPVFLFALAVSASTKYFEILWIFFILHVLLYPASNGYNSYFDKDEGSIGGLKHPPKTSKELYGWSIALDVLAIMMGWWISWQFAAMLLIYGLVSKAYSHPLIRLKSMPIIGWLAAGIFQGYFTFLMVVLGLKDFDGLELIDWQWQLPAILSSMLLMGSYPMTQVYQHEEDSQRGDITMSILLGVLGTFYFTGLFFFVSNLGFLYYFYTYFDWMTALAFQLSLLPVMGYFFFWFLKVRKDERRADFEHTMRLNLISSLLLNVFFLGWYLLR